MCFSHNSMLLTFSLLCPFICFAAATVQCSMPVHTVLQLLQFSAMSFYVRFHYSNSNAIPNFIALVLLLCNNWVLLTVRTV